MMFVASNVWVKKIHNPIAAALPRSMARVEEAPKEEAPKDFWGCGAVMYGWCGMWESHDHKPSPNRFLMAKDSQDHPKCSVYMGLPHQTKTQEHREIWCMENRDVTAGKRLNITTEKLGASWLGDPDLHLIGWIPASPSEVPRKRFSLFWCPLFVNPPHSVGQSFFNHWSPLFVDSSKSQSHLWLHKTCKFSV